MAPDLVLFLVVVAGFFVIGLPLITRRVWLPVELETEDVPEADLTDPQRAYFADLDGQLSDLAFRTARTYRVTNLQGYNMVRTYLSDADPAMVHAMLLRSEVGPANQPTSMNYLEIATRYADGTAASTRNGDLSSVFDEPPNIDVAVRRTARRAADLKAAHDRRTEGLKPREPLYARADDLFGLLAEHHEKWSRYQVEKGQLRIDHEAGLLRPTAKTGLRGIANFLNPFADNATPLRVVLALVLGLGLPVAGVLLLGDPGSPWVERLAAAVPLGPVPVHWIALAGVFAVLGVATGWLFEGKSFIWTFLLAWFPLRLLGPSVWPALLLSMWAAGIAGSVCGHRMRRKALV